jgi:hypothetical protein
MAAAGEEPMAVDTALVNPHANIEGVRMFAVATV